MPTRKRKVKPAPSLSRKPGRKLLRKRTSRWQREEREEEVRFSNKQQRLLISGGKKRHCNRGK